MTNLIKTQASLIWLLLMLLTAISWSLGEGVDYGENTPTAIFSLLLMFAAIVKVRLVVLHFMDVKIAPAFLRIAMEVWFIVIFLLIALFYLHGAEIAAFIERPDPRVSQQ